MTHRALGDRQVFPVGLGTAGLGVADPPPREESLRLVQTALAEGVTLFDTATCYVPSHHDQGYGEALLRDAIAGSPTLREAVVVASKAGIKRIATDVFERDFETDASPAEIVRQCDASLAALGTDCIDLYFLHAPDPNTPLVDTVAAFDGLRAEGKIAMIGLCNVTISELELACEVTRIDAVQNAFSPMVRDHLDVVEWCAARDIAFLAYSPLGGLGERARDLGARAPAFTEIAEERGVSVHRVALAWELARAPVVIPIPGPRRVETLRDSLAAATLSLTDDERRRLDG